MNHITEMNDLKKSELNSVCKWRLKALGTRHKDRNLRQIFETTNTNGEKYLFARFVKNRTDEIIATIAYWDETTGWIPSSGI